MIGSQANVIGGVFAFLTPLIFIDNYEAGETLTDAMKEKYKSQVFNMFLAVAIVGVVTMIAALLAFRERPEVPVWGLYGISESSYDRQAQVG